MDDKKNPTEVEQNPIQTGENTTSQIQTDAQTEVSPQAQGQVQQPTQQSQVPEPMVQPEVSQPQATQSEVSGPGMIQQMESIPNQPPKNGISKRTLMLIIFLIVAVILLLITYMALLNKKPSISPSPVVVPAVPTATPVALTDEEQLESIDVGDVDADLQEIDADLNNL